MQISSREFLLMMISTLSANWSDGINRACGVCFASSLERISRLRTISPRRHFCAHTRTSAAFAAKRVFPHGSIELPTILFEKTRVAVRNLSELMKNSFKPSMTLKLPILV